MSKLCEVEYFVQHKNIALLLSNNISPSKAVKEALHVCSCPPGPDKKETHNFTIEF